MEYNTITSRLEKDLEHLKQFTATPGAGCTRLPFTPEARKAVDYLHKIMDEAGLEVVEDAAGNIFGIFKGEDPDAPCVMMGSHYDSVVNGGDYDGIGGIISAIEVARMMKEAGFTPKRNYVAAGFCDEEGMRFGTGYFGSYAMLGKIDEDYCKHFSDKDGITVYDAMKSYGLVPEKVEEAAQDIRKIGSFIETHIEQGRILEQKGIDLGLVESIVGIQRFMFTIHGRSDHAGATPMDMRLDPVLAGSRVIVKINEWIRELGLGSVATVGYVKALPGGINIVANDFEFSVDIRSKDNGIIREMVDRIKDFLDYEVNNYTGGKGSFEYDQKLEVVPVAMTEAYLEAMAKGCDKHGYSYTRMISGAGHDSLAIGPVIPTVMLFVPSRDGCSHNMNEYTSYEQFAKATVIAYELVCDLLDK